MRYRVMTIDHAEKGIPFPMALSHTLNGARSAILHLEKEDAAGRERRRNFPIAGHGPNEYRYTYWIEEGEACTRQED